MTMILEKKLYTATATSTGGRDGHSRTDDGKVELEFTKPVELGGSGKGTNPEQLFAMGYSACYIGALKHVAALEKVNIGNDISVTANVSLGTIGAGFGIAVHLVVDIKGVDEGTAMDLVEKAHKVCPYSNATRGNVDVTTALA